MKILAITILLTGLLFAESSFPTQKCGLKNYLCPKCSTLIKSPKFPSGMGCPSGGLHKWVDLGEVGDDVFQCKKCSILLRSKSFPSSTGCPSGGLHQWNKL